MGELKQVMVMRTDLGMGKGKIAAQAAHASLGSAEQCRTSKPGWYEDWREQGQAKVVVKAASETELRELFKKAKTLGLPASLIEDKGLTQLEPGTVTCIGIGPAPVELVDKITGKLKLL
jgi:peptidyl-tRNA hydrolase, PTH2 family